MKKSTEVIYFPDDINPWSVRARSERYTILTRGATQSEVDKYWEERDANPYMSYDPEFKAGTIMYTIVDYLEMVRGACNLIGGGWGDGFYSDEDCQELLESLELGEVEVSRRNRVPLGIWNPK